MDWNPTELLGKLHAAQARQELLLGLLHGLRQTSEPDVMMWAAVAAIGQHLRVDRVGFFQVKEDEALAFSVCWTNGRLPALTGTFPAAAIGTGYLAQVRAGKTIGISDTRTDPLTADSLFSEIGTVSLIGVPIIRNQRWHAGLYVNHAAIRDWCAEDVELVREVGELTWDAVERVRAVTALRKSEERLTLALEAGGGIGTWDWDLPADRVYCNARFASVFSVDPERAAAGAPLADFLQGVHPDDRGHVALRIQSAIDDGFPYADEFRALAKDGSVLWVYARGQCQYDTAGKPLRLPGVLMEITERKQAEMNLRKQWNTFDIALSHTPDFAYTFDLQGRFTYANRALLSLLQKTQSEVVGKDFFGLDYPPDLAERLQSQIQRVIDSKQTLRDETPFTAPSGNTGVYEYIFVPVFGESGALEAVAGSTREITERKRSEGFAEADRRRWRDLLARAPAGIAVLRGPDHRFDWANDEYVRLLGRPASAFLGKTVREALPEVEGQIYVGLLNSVFETGEPFVGHESLLRLTQMDGAEVNLYVNFVYMPTRDAAGEIDGIFVHVADVTDMVLSRKRVQESEQRFRQLADSMPQIVWTARPDGALDYYNERWYEFTGSDRLLSGDRSWSAIVHPDERKRIRDAWYWAVESGELFQTELRFWDMREQRWRWFMSRAIAVRDGADQIVKWFGTSTDIDDQKASQQALFHRQKLESIGLLAGGIAHDFNNLLVGIMGSASFALDTIPASHPAYGMLQNVVESSDRAAHLTRQMLAYAGKGKFIIEPLNLSEMAAQTTQLVSASVPKSVALRLDLDDHLPAVESDPGQMQQVVMNLVLNAAEAVGEKNGVVTVRTRTETVFSGDNRRSVDSLTIEPGKYVVLEVQDTGSGIDAATLTKIFDPFFTTKFTGRGLGLAAVAGIIRSHQGGIEVETEIGEGSTFRVLLPASRAHFRAAVGAVAGPSARAFETVLVIDDESVVRRVAKAGLEKSGYRVLLASDGKQGIESVRHDAALALVLLDMSMPGLSGREVLEAIKAIRPELPVVVCSGYSEDEVFREFSGLEIAGVLPKPFTVSRLMAQVRTALDGTLDVKAS